jgi:hypothetical protein
LSYREVGPDLPGAICIPLAEARQLYEQLPSLLNQHREEGV